MRQVVFAAALVGLLTTASVPARAHAGYEHFLGTVTAIDAHHVELETSESPVALVLNAETRCLRKGETVAWRELKRGTPVVVDARRQSGAWVAKEIRIVVDPR